MMWSEVKEMKYLNTINGMIRFIKNMKLYDAINEALLSALFCVMYNQFGFNIKVQYTFREVHYKKGSSVNG